MSKKDIYQLLFYNILLLFLVTNQGKVIAPAAESVSLMVSIIF